MRQGQISELPYAVERFSSFNLNVEFIRFVGEKSV